MATIKFILQSKLHNAPVYLRLSMGRGKSIKRKTGFITDAKKWNDKKGLSKDTSASGKVLNTDLKKLEAFIYEKYNLDNSKGKTIDGDWLLKWIDKFYDRDEPEKEDYLLEYTKQFIENLPSRVNKGTVGVSEGTITKYKTICKKIELYENFVKKKVLLKDVDTKFRESFIKFLREYEVIGDNTIGRYIVNIKTIVSDARAKGHEVSPQINDFKGFSTKPPIVTVSFEEIEKLKNLNLSDENMKITRDWFVIGCYTGQRVSDLLRMNSSMIIEVKGYRFIEITQRKTDSTIQIPIHPEVEDILKRRNGEFPKFKSSSFASQANLFNKLLKKICEKAGFNELTKGNLTNKDTNRKQLDEYPKWKLISSHCCRRSFCSNFYAKKEYPTPLLMYVSGHKKESVFLSYIGKKPIDFGLQLAEIWSQKETRKQKDLGLLKQYTGE